MCSKLRHCIVKESETNELKKCPMKLPWHIEVSHLEVCITWIVNSGRDDFSELRDNQLRARYICSNHFQDSAFTNSTRKKLLYNNNPLAVPMEHWNAETCLDVRINDFSNEASVADEPRLSSGKETTENFENLKEVSVTNSSVHCDLFGSGKETTTDFDQDFQPLQQEESEIQIIPKPTTGNNDMNTSPTPRKKKLLKTINRQKSVLKIRSNKLSFCRKKLYSSHKLDEGSVMKYLATVLKGEPLTFVKMQIKHQKRSKWNEEEKNLSLSIYYKSPSLYRFLLDRGFKLPCIRIIQYWVNVHNIKPGFSEEVFNKLRVKASSMTPDERQCVLMCDEMSIKKYLEYNPKYDVIEGFEDLGILGRTDKLATHALVFMIRGLKHTWKCPVAYVVSNNSIKASSLAILIDVAIEKVISASFSLKAIVSDLGSTNASAMRLLGVTKENPFLYFGNDKIYCLFDYPHLLKCVRNNLLRHDLVVNGQIVSWSAIREFHEVDKQSMTDCRAAPKLSERHLNPQPFQKMKVNLASQVFSASVSRGMKAAHHLGLLKDETCLSTSEFLGRINDITDCMNSKNLNDSNPLKRPLKSENPKVILCLQEAISYIASWSVVGSPPPPCFDGLQQTIQGVLSLYEEEFKDQKSFLLTGRLNQDPLENLFGVLRRRSGYNSNPSAKEFRRNLQHCMSVRLMDPPSSANCEPDGDNTLVIPENPDEVIGTEIDKENIDFTNMDTDNNPDIENSETPSWPDDQELVTGVDQNPTLSGLEENVICYIAGWLGKKCIEKYSCTDCKLQLIRQSEHLNFHLDREHLINFKTFTKHDGTPANLCRPSDDLLKSLKIQSLAFSQLFPKIWSSENLSEKLVGHLFSETQKDFPEWWQSENDHKLYIVKLFVKCKLFNCMKWKSNDLRDKAILKKRLIGQADEGKQNEKLKKLKNL